MHSLGTAARLDSLVRELFPAGPAQRESTRATWPTLPYTIRLARTPRDLRAAVALRRQSYRRHFGPDFECELEPADVQAGSLVFIAADKRDDAVIGTARFATNRMQPLYIGSQLDLEPMFGNTHLADVHRLAVTSGTRGKLVKLGLFKATYLCAQALQVRHLVIGARSTLERDYLRLGFGDPGGHRTMLETLGRPHRLLSLDIAAAERRWREMQHPLYQFMVVDFHPDIDPFVGSTRRWIDVRANDEEALLPSASLSGISTRAQDSLSREAG